MRAIRELVDIADKRKVDQRFRLSFGANKETLLERLYLLVLNGKLEEAEIVAKLYDQSKSEKYAPFRNVKNRLYHLLLSVMINDIDELGEITDYDDATIIGYRYMNAMRIMHRKRAYQSAIRIGKSTLRKVEKYQLVPLNYALSDLLAGLHLGVNYNPRLYNIYQTKALYYSGVQRVFDRVQHNYREIRNLTYAFRVQPKEIGEIALNYCEEYENEVNKYPEISLLQAYFYSTKMLGMMYAARYREGLAVANSALTVLSKCEGVSKIAISSFHLQRVECALKLKDFTLSSFQIERAKAVIDPLSINGIKVSQFAANLGLETGHYSYAYDAIQNVDRVNLKRKITPNHVGYWLILEAYINLMALTGRIPDREFPVWSEKFKISKTINDVTFWTKNKQGMNIQLIVLEFIYNLVEGKFGRITDRSGGVVRYGNRYLKNNDQLRNNCFIKMLSIAEHYSFNRATTLKRTEKIYQKMISPEAIELSKANSTEIVPYEVLWEIVVEYLVAPTVRSSPE